MEEPIERHLECTECKKPIVVVYTEIIGKMIYRMGMCADCPLLSKKLHGQTHAIEASGGTILSCGGCGLTEDEVKMGAPLGCSLCYEVFEELLIQELLKNGRIAQKFAGVKKIVPLHMGRAPGEVREVSNAMKLLELHQALHETLGQENYEQAAYLRDQIKALTKEEEKKKEENTNGT